MKWFPYCMLFLKLMMRCPIENMLDCLIVMDYHEENYRSSSYIHVDRGYRYLSKKVKCCHILLTPA